MIKHALITISIAASLLSATALTGCTVFSEDNRDYSTEEMFDLASKLKDLATAVDGTLKFSDTKFDQSTHSQTALLLEAVNNDVQKLEPFSDYELILSIQEDNAILLLCDDDIALIEDIGCTAKSDLQHWQATQSHSCQITLDATALCQ